MTMLPSVCEKPLIARLFFQVKVFRPQHRSDTHRQAQAQAQQGRHRGPTVRNTAELVRMLRVWCATLLLCVGSDRVFAMEQTSLVGAERDCTYARV